jgi:hypothetical protein
MERTQAERGALLGRYIGKKQLATMQQLTHGEEGQWFKQKLLDIELTIDQHAGKCSDDDDSIVIMHYFHRGGDWWILEIPKDPDEDAAFGYVRLTAMPECAELGSISIDELIENGVELDLYWAPCTLSSVRERHSAES